jgi:hypothetical protein
VFTTGLSRRRRSLFLMNVLSWGEGVVSFVHGGQRVCEREEKKFFYLQC